MRRRLFEADEKGLEKGGYFWCVKILGDNCGSFGGQ